MTIYILAKNAKQATAWAWENRLPRPGRPGGPVYIDSPHSLRGRIIGPDDEVVAIDDWFLRPDSREIAEEMRRAGWAGGK